VSRTIRKSRAWASRDAHALLAGVFAAELVAPSRCLWIVSPWISDVPLIDNRADSFEEFRPLGPRWIRLSEVLANMAERGTTIVVATTPAPTNEGFRRRVHARFDDLGQADRLAYLSDTSNELHEKAITTDDAVIVGSMNITNNGIFVREEFVELRTDTEFVAAARMDAYDRFGGRL
jgi:phosphatidylserine/phosphatidylglycerophosphate/cardiolipin synthase-like enzyme